MKRTESDKKRTDKAWEKLQSRLEKEGLLTSNTQASFPKWKAAAILIIGILSILSVLPDKSTDTPKDFLTTHNTETSTTQVIVLEDSSIVLLNGQSSLTYPNTFAKGKREVTLYGNAMFQVKGNPERPFHIKTESCEVEVLGTTFYIRNDGKDFFESGVRNGKIKITLPKNVQAVSICEGEKMRWHNNTMVLTNTTTNDFDEYTRNLRFKDEPLSHVLQVINRLSSNKHILFEATPAVGHRKLTFTYTNNTPKDFAILISTVLGITYQQKGTSIIFKEQKP